MALIPITRIIHADGMGPEGVGVSPNRDVQPEREDLLRGVDTQLKAAVDCLLSTAGSGM